MRNVLGGLPLLTMPEPQLEMQPLIEPAGGGVQKSAVVPQKPQLLQQALSGHGLSSVHGVLSVGLVVPGTWGPQMVPGSAGGKGGDPELRQMTWLGWSFAQPAQAHVFLLTSSMRACVIPKASLMDQQPSPGATVYARHEPSALGCGVSEKVHVSMSNGYGHLR